MFVCVLLVAALAGQPAWGDDERGADSAGPPTMVVTPPPPPAHSATSGKAKKAAKAKKATTKRTTVRRAKRAHRTSRKAHRTSRKATAVKTKAAKKKAHRTKAHRTKAHKKSKATARQESVPTEPPVDNPPPPPPPPAADEPDPTPPAESDPAPVPVPEAPPEAGAEVTPPPPPAAADEPPPADIPVAPTPEESPIPPGSDLVPTDRIPSDVAPAEPETAVPGSLAKKITDTPFLSDPGGSQGAGNPSGTTPGGQTATNDGGSSPSGALGPSSPTGGALPGVLVAPGSVAGNAGTPSSNPVVAGPRLLPAATDIFAQRTGASTSRAPRGATSNVGTLRQPSSIGLNKVASLVKDIPTWIKLALAGLLALVLALGAYTVLAAARTRRLERQRAKLMEDIGLLQAALLPAVPGRLGALLTTVAYRPADGPGAGGDFYDAFALSDGRVGLLLGDISGHGRQALAKTTLVRFTVRAHLEAGMSPREALAISGRSLDGRLADDFSTVIAAIHDPVKGTLTYASAGHPPPLVAGPHAHEPVTASSAPPIGAGFPTGQRQTVLPMPEGTTVCVYSDGLLEARVDGDVLGRERLRAWLHELGPQATAKALLDLVVQRADRVPDDLAAVVLHAAPGATAPAARVEQLKLDVLDVEGPELDGFLKACGVSRADRAITGRRVSEQLAVSGGVVVEVRIGEHPMVSVASIGDHTASGARSASRVR
ncbi:MAG: phosphoserine phosphatase RsbU/P [Solirubrobacteraceae bacterium]|nr:phosphoserine phosphatase RsbU/P [Solirubrobacteraceae bacterium]